MSIPINDGGPAFPRAGFLSEIVQPEQVIAQYENKPEQGMTLRDYFAGQALEKASRGSDRSADEIAKRAFYIADAMLAARKEASK